MSKAKSIAIWSAIALSSAAFAAAGSAKLMGVPQLHASFAIMGLPHWFGYLIGASELAGAIGLLWRKLSALAATGLAAIMAGAIYFHLVYDAAAHAIPALVLSALLLVVIVARRQEALWFPGRQA